jgi:DNA polymerase-3 subunit beta
METETALDHPPAASAGAGLAVRCERQAFVDALSVVGRAASSRTNVHVLGGVLVQPAPGGVQLSATDMELSLRTTLPAEVTGDGAVVVPGRLLTDVARLLPDASVSLAYTPEDGVAAVSSGTYASRLHVYDPADFPRLPTVEVPLQTVETSELLAAIQDVARAASRDESRPVLTGILVRFEGAALVMAATDSYRLAVRETTLAQPGPELEAIIPARALTELARLAAGRETVTVGANENHVVFGTGDVWLTTRRIDGQFPNYKQLLPETFEAELALPREELRGIVKRAAVMAQRNTPLRLRFAEGELTVSARSQDVGETTESMPAAYTGEPLEIGFNAEFLADGLDAVSGDTVELKLINPLRPGLISEPGKAFWYLIMPIRLAG